MFEALFNLRLDEPSLSMAAAVVYGIILVPSLLRRRFKFCLLLTFMFAYYLAFLWYWKDLVGNTNGTLSFVLYAMGGVLLVILVVVESCREQPGRKKKRVAAPESSES